MMKLNVHTLRSSFARAITRQPDFARRFYDELFLRYPDVKPLFPEDIRERPSSTSVAALSRVVSNIVRPAALADSLRALGRQHEISSATPRAYVAIGECLIETMCEALGPSWDDELEYQWSAAFVEIVSLVAPEEAFYETIPAPPFPMEEVPSSRRAA